MFVDRFLHTSMIYPGNYGFIPHTLSADGDPCDVLVVGQSPVIPGAIIRSRPVGVLLMEDEKGVDEKILAVPGLAEELRQLRWVSGSRMSCGTCTLRSSGRTPQPARGR
jgi:inorganic pyrophosphatase